MSAWMKDAKIIIGKRQKPNYFEFNIQAVSTPELAHQKRTASRLWLVLEGRKTKFVQTFSAFSSTLLLPPSWSFKTVYTGTPSAIKLLKFHSDLLHEAPQNAQDICCGRRSAWSGLSLPATLGLASPSGSSQTSPSWTGTSRSPPPLQHIQSHSSSLYSTTCHPIFTYIPKKW